MRPLLYPPPFRRGTPRTTAIRILNLIVDETGHVERWPSTYLDLRSMVIERNLALYVPTIQWPHSVLAARDKLLWSNKARKFNGVRVVEGRRAWTIAMSSNWPGLLDDPSSGLKSLRSLFDACGVGDYPTPGGLGQALMRKWFDRQRGKFQRPPMGCVEDILEHMIGGTSFLFKPGAWGRVNEDDLNMAYPAAMREVPSGQAHNLGPDEDPLWTQRSRFAWWFGEYAWVNEAQDCLIPILGIRRANGAVDYPTSLGSWHTGWYTKQEVLAATLKGYRTTWLRGWGWTKTSNALSAWTDHIATIRDRFAGLARDWAKLASVAAIGRFGIQPVRYTVGLPGTRRTSDQLDRTMWITECATGKPLFAIERVPSTNNPELLPHVAAKVHADVRLRAFHRALPLAREGRLVATNFDAVYYTGERNRDHSDEVGEWKTKELIEATFPARRWLITPEGQKTPGLAHA